MYGIGAGEFSARRKQEKGKVEEKPRELVQKITTSTNK